MKTQISVYLLKGSVTADADALKPDLTGVRQPPYVFDAGESRGTLFVKDSPSEPPLWRKLLGGDIQPPATDVNQNTSAVLVLASSGRRFAVTFGHGWTMLDNGAYERRFGLKVALNALDPDQLRAAQARNFGGVAQHTSRQLARLSGVDAFELDWQRDLVTSLDGVTVEAAVGTRLSGRDSVRLAHDVHASDLASICAELLALSLKQGYTADYPLIDNIVQVDDPGEIDRLDYELADRLVQGKRAGIDLYPPEMLPETVERFAIKPPRKERWGIGEAGLVLVNAPLKGVQSVAGARKALNAYKLVGLEGSEEVASWTLWECLTCELLIGGKRYIRNGLTWFRVDEAFLKEVDAFIAGIPSTGLDYPAWDGKTHEGPYNAATATSKGWALMDKKNITLPDRTAVEPCDLVTGKGHIIHVKQRGHGSAPISHAIGQACVAADLLKNVPEFRTEMRARLAAGKAGFENLIQDDPAAITKLPVVLALMTAQPAKTSVGEALPFFTKVFLMQNFKRLRNIGFEVYLDEITVPAPLHVLGVKAKPGTRTRRGGNAAPAPWPRRIGKARN